MTHKSQFAKALTALVALALFVTGCTKTRDASLPEDAQESNFSISEVDSLQKDSQMKVSTDERLSNLSLGESSKATAEKGVVAVTDVEVPNRLKYMFKGLEMTGQAGHSYPIALSVDKQFVTAYKVVSDASELSILEKQLAQVKDEVLLQKQLQKTKNNAEVKTLMAKLKETRAQKATALAKKGSNILVPLFKFKVTGYGVLQRTKNELKEETSTLRLKTTDWSEATHFTMSINPSDRIPVGLDPASRGDMDRTFVMDRINNKIMTAGVLKNEFQIPVNTKDDARVLTLLDVDALHVFEIGQLGKTELTDSQVQQLKLGSNKSNVRQCSDEIKKALPETEQANCILILRYDVPVKYVRPELPVVDYDGNQDAKISFKEVRAGENVGLVQIEQNVQPKKVENNNEMDPRTTIRVADIKGKEFFFKRTLEDAPVTTIFPPGMAGNLTIVKFELEESRLVVRKADKLVNYKSGSNDADVEELMSIPVKYLKHDTKDASGAEYSMARLVPASRVDAEFIELDWTKNTLTTAYSPYASINEPCFDSFADVKVSDVDMHLDKGILNFSFGYSTGLRLHCVAEYNVTNDYNGTANFQVTARLKERVSFKLNDGTTDKSFVAKIPFRAQNELGYGVWTIGQINPTETGLIGREGQEMNFPVVHDFRNGKTLVYTVTGLEPSVDLPADIRQLYRDTATDVVNAWDFAYHQAFKGTALERKGRYVEIQFSGDAGVEAKVGDLDKNIVHFENKFNGNHGVLGVSQVGFNPRSGIVVADSLIIYAGNLQQYVAGSQRNLKISQKWADMKKEFKKQALEELSKQQQAEADAQKKAAEAAKPGASAEQKAEVAAQFTKQLVKMAQGKKADAKVFVNAKNMSLTSGDVKKAVAQMKSLGAGKFNYSAPQMESAWIDRVLRKFAENRQMDSVELEGLVAKEMLASRGAKLSPAQKAELEASARKGAVRTQLNAHFKNSPGCLLTERDGLARNFTARTFKEALRQTLFFDMGHEMGHSQGLTHNFIGSFDKANFSNEDGSETKRNYSSIMDYFEPSQFNWDGIGTYDIHALRASHLGLLEVTPEFKAKLEKQGAAKILVNDKFITIQAIQANFAKNGWNNFNKYQINGLLKPYKYCTDIHVGYEPTCQRFDYGTSAQEIVENLALDYEENYVQNYHSWDRNNFGVGMAGRVIGGTIGTMFQMRQYLDELFYKLVLRNGTQEEIGDYVQASLKAYIFYNQVIKTPDAHSLFESADRFVAVPYQYKERNEQGEETGKVITDVEIVEKRAVQDLAIREDRIDTVGVEYDKIMAMNFLTMKGYPDYKYYSQSIQFSFLDFEKYILGMGAEESFFVNTLTGMMLDQLQPTFTNEHATLSPVRGEKATVTSAMRAYAGIYGILNLEASTLRDKDNFANFFKVGSSVGKAPSDRVVLSQLGVSDKSKTRLSYWALDNAIASNLILQVAAEKNFFIQKEGEIAPLMEKVVIAQFQDMLSQGKKAEDVAKAKADLIAKLNELNKKGEIVSEEMLKANPQMTIEGQVEGMVGFNKQVIGVAVALLTQQQGADQIAQQVAEQAGQLAEALPLFALDQKAIKSGLDKIGKAMSQTKGMEGLAQLGDAAGQLVDGTQIEISYGIIMKNVEFLNMLTLMTNPEYNR
ncbi:zinc-dependent metalloprotease [uncultured Bdellovibrio sp.]|uniref:zinc-dependent metalloprotease n=1 Tax=Bdellovibrio sp. HCB-162 TaxID=3394234 RepID=UPI0025FE428F|nr:zinc-dependent metalloprotease [uncultured Bdellovibrio sp.]